MTHVMRNRPFQKLSGCMETAARPWWLAAKNLFFPIFCRVCRERVLTEENGYYCPTCWELAVRICPPFCTYCGRPHESMVGLGSRGNFPCAHCRKRPPKHASRIYGAAVYEGVIADAIKQLKFHDKHRLARPLGDLLCEFAGAHMETGQYDLLVPVPLHRVRLRDRGYNQSALLASQAMNAFSNAKLTEALKRIRPTRTQSKLAGKQRRENVRGAFAAAGDHFVDRTVLLIDDVITSGGTIEACAQALCRAGARRIDVLAVALARRNG